ncbi:long-chain-fatty-acid--CoA ligase [Labedaea rhizosphaerae]|uniref:Acyl-CoA synthetase (AMP-forming)/AMP-acid ligase II n=1 Tax=Labedaea rhizosphaerae TaxID=598644 RepID=A0A4R6SR16_LABRH|nr:long-chain-fatty-acid--CoA ligase [Labedaea rhizosphaerae]TDQ05723.1 acyl-CoA synthetase (AMP-forming)/AMP-acid ligase II [Labedaea rhizosphaerae]
MPDSPSDIADIVEFWAGQRPDGVAVRFGDQAWTWAQWQDRIARNVGAQLAAGLEPGDRVAFLDKNHPACLETTLACALVGTANAVVNFRLAADEIAFVVDDAQATVLFAGPEFLPIVEKIRDRIPTVRQVIEIGEPYERWLQQAQPARARPYLRDDCFLQLYTSGTTGFPKGAMLTHRGMTAHSEAVGADSELGPDCVGMVAMPLFHVGGTSWALAALFAGAEIVVVRDIVPNLLLDELVSARITHSFFVPAVFAFMLQVPDVAQRDWSALRLLVYGASPMPLPLLRNSLKVFPCGFRQVYGMTEAGGVVTSLGPEEHRDPAREHLLTSAGKPIPGVEAKVVDPVTGEPAGVGEVGEVLVHTEQLMSGYWRRDADQQSVDADGWLHSGDAGYLDAEGYLFISDRIKDMIISGGENIYPAEIERVLAEHPAIADVAVIGVPDDKWGEVPYAIVVAAPGAEVDEEKLLAHCREHLAAFKCPKSVQVLTELPRNPTGKILKRKLREPFWAGRDRAV